MYESFTAYLTSIYGFGGRDRFEGTFVVACVQTSPISFMHAEKGRLRNAVVNRVLASCWVPKILGTRCDRLTHSAHCLT